MVGFHVAPINVPTLSPLMAFSMLPGLFRLKTTTVPKGKGKDSISGKATLVWKEKKAINLIPMR